MGFSRGTQLFKAGIILQLFSFSFFTILVLVFTTRVYSQARNIWTADKGAGTRDWRWLLFALSVACVTILVSSSRAILRVIPDYASDSFLVPCG